MPVVIISPAKIFNASLAEKNVSSVPKNVQLFGHQLITRVTISALVISREPAEDNQHPYQGNQYDEDGINNTNPTRNNLQPQFWDSAQSHRLSSLSDLSVKTRPRGRMEFLG